MNKNKWTLVLAFILIVSIVVMGCSSNENKTANAKTNTSSNKTPKSEKTTKDVLPVVTDQDSKQKETKNTKIYLTTENINLREGASTTERVIDMIPTGKEVTYISRIGTWYKVSYESKIGYVSSEYLKDVTKMDRTSTAKSHATLDSYNVPILMYHAIAEYKGNGIKELYVSPENFEQQMQYLKEAGFTLITFDDLKNIKNINKPVMVTLDDGYKNNVNVYNILKKLNNSSFQGKATIFMVGRKIDTKSGLSTQQLKEMSDSGIISIQSHTETHLSLVSVTNYQKELGSIKEKLENITGKKVIALSYPAGQYDDQVIAETKKYYDYAVTTKPGIADTRSSHYEMKRIRITYSTTLSTFKHLIN